MAWEFKCLQPTQVNLTHLLQKYLLWDSTPEEEGDIAWPENLGAECDYQNINRRHYGLTQNPPAMILAVKQYLLYKAVVYKPNGLSEHLEGFILL